MTKFIHRITYPSEKIYAGKDLTDSINYFGSADSATIAGDFTMEQQLSLTVTREILWSSEIADNREIAGKAIEFIRNLYSNEPKVEYNRLS